MTLTRRRPTERFFALLDRFITLNFLLNGKDRDEAKLIFAEICKVQDQIIAEQKKFSK